MKKWITILAAVLLLLTCPVTALATEPAPAAVPERHGVPVYGICQSSRNYYEITLGVHGLDTEVLPDGVTIRGSSDSAAANGSLSSPSPPRKRRRPTPGLPMPPLSWGRIP